MMKPQYLPFKQWLEVKPQRITLNTSLERKTERFYAWMLKTRKYDFTIYSQLEDLPYHLPYYVRVVLARREERIYSLLTRPGCSERTRKELNVELKLIDMLNRKLTEALHG